MPDNHKLGHGHVRPNPDGSKARCGGPRICSECALEAAQFAREAKSTAREAAEQMREAAAKTAGSFKTWRENVPEDILATSHESIHSSFARIVQRARGNAYVEIMALPLPDAEPERRGLNPIHIRVDPSDDRVEKIARELESCREREAANFEEVKELRDTLVRRNADIIGLTQITADLRAKLAAAEGQARPPFHIPPVGEGALLAIQEETERLFAPAAHAWAGFEDQIAQILKKQFKPELDELRARLEKAERDRDVERNANGEAAEIVSELRAKLAAAEKERDEAKTATRTDAWKAAQELKEKLVAAEARADKAELAISDARLRAWKDEALNDLKACLESERARADAEQDQAERLAKALGLCLIRAAEDAIAFEPAADLKGGGR